MRKIIFLLLWSLNISLYGQSFQDWIGKLSGQLQTVTTGSKEYSQALQPLDNGSVRYTLTQTDSKGRSKITNYTFNFADIDPHTVRAYTQRDVVLVAMATDKGERMIMKQGENDNISYINKLNFFATDMENGRQIAETIKKIIPIARQLVDKHLSLSGYEDRLGWLLNHVENVSIDDKTYEQNLQKGHFAGAIILNKKISGSHSEKDYTYYINLAFMDPRQVKFEIKGNVFTIKLGTRHGKKFIKNINNTNGSITYDSKINIVARDIEQARDMKKIFIEIIPLAEKRFNKEIPVINSLSQGYELINRYAQKAGNGKWHVEQHAEGDCLLQLTQTIDDEKKSIEHQYKFNLKDINDKQIEPLWRHGIIGVSLKTKNGKKYIRHNANGELQNYTTTVYIFAPGAEEALYIQSALKKMVQRCQSHKAKRPAGAQMAGNILKKEIKNVETGNYAYEQELNIDISSGKLEFKKLINSGKSTKEYLYEAALKDLDPKKVEINVSGNKVFVTIKTKHQEKVIKSYKDGKVQPYQYKMDIMADGIEHARKIKNALEVLFESVK